MRSCFSLVGCGVLLAAGLVAGWLARDEIAAFASRLLDRGETPIENAASAGPELARQVDAKVIALGQGELDEATLSVAELNAWIEHGLQGYFPHYVSDVVALIEDEKLVLAGRVAVQEIPGIERLGSWVAFLGDTASVTAQGRLDGLGPGAGVYYIDGIQVGALPLPDAFRDQLLAELGGGARPGLPDNAIAFELPRFVTDIGVHGSEVVFRSSLERGR
jgi:hypothetical protein